MKVIDCVTYNGEKELFEIRYNILKDFVDEFIVVEFDKTFSGKSKESLFLRDFGALKGVAYHWHTEKTYSKYKELAENSPNTKGAEHWKTEFMMKESIKDALIAMELKDDDIVFIGDCDEIWEPEIIGLQAKLRLRVYAYYLNNLSNEQFYGTITLPYKHIKNECLNHLRSNMTKDDHYSGWHFTSMHHQLEKKLTDSYTKESYATDEVMANLKDNIEKNKDFLGRNFTYKVDETDWPSWLKENRTRYLHLLK